MFLKRASAVACAVLLSTGGRSIAQSSFDLSIDNIMRGPGLYGYEPQDIRWSGDNQRIYFSWKQPGDNPESPRDTYFIYRDRGAPVKLSEQEARQAPPASGILTRDRSRAVYSLDGDVFLYDYATDKVRQLTKTAATETNPHFTRDEKRVAFTRDGNLFVMSLDTGLIEQMTEIVPPGQGPKKDEKKDDEKTETSQDFLAKQEKDLIQAVRDKLRLKDADEGVKKRLHPRKPYELKPRQTVTELKLCPDETCVIAMIDQAAEGSKPDNVPNYVTESGYTEEIAGRTNVGDLQRHQAVVILSTETGEAKPVDTGLGTREVTYFTPLFSEQGTAATMMVRAVDNKDRWIMALDTGSAKARSVFTDHDDAWIGGPGEEILGWLKDGATVYFASERDGWEHLYTAPIAGGDAKQLTAGQFEIDQVDLSNDGSTFYIISTEASPHEQQVYTLSTNGGSRTRWTTKPGGHRLILSRDEKYFADVYSYVNQPPDIYVGENHAQAAIEKRTDSPAREFRSYPWLDPQIVQVPARDGAVIPARFFKPANYQPGGPAVIFVHGAGYLQNVTKYWSPYPHEFLFHHFLLQHGYMVLDMDYRASQGYGRDWRTAIYRHMGGKDLDDNVDGAKWLVQQGADPKRIGVYGGSYGGFITLMAMFTSPDTFAAGAALRPVTDWSHYNHEYTSDILNTPQNDAEAYRQSSPIYFAEGLKGALLICHGMVDTNVFFQDTVRLTQRLIELRKENWSVAMYPVENHGFVKATSWADEYKRIFKLFETNLKGGKK